MTTVKAQGISKYEGTAWILVMDRNEGRKTNKIQKKCTERTNMEEKKLHKKHIIEMGKNKIQLKKPPQNHPHFIYFHKKDCLCIPSLGDLQNTILKIVLLSQFNKTVTF